LAQPHLNEQHLECSLHANPRQPAAWCALGDARLKLRKLAEAQAAFENAVGLDNRFAAAHFGLAAVFKEQNSAQEAIACFQRGLAIEPANIEALMGLAMLLAGQGQTGEAIERWRAVVRLKPDHWQAFHNLGVAFAQQGESEQAIRHLQHALKIKPDYAEAHYNLGSVLTNAAPHARPTLDPATPETPLARRQQAVQHYLAAIRVRPGYAEAYHNLGSLLTEMGRAKEGVVWLRQAVRLCEAGELMRFGKTRPAAPAPEAPVSNPRPFEASPDADFLAKSSLPSALNQLGLALSASARYREAERCYYRALGFKPDFGDVHSNLGNLFQEQGRLAEALASYEMAIAHEPQSVSSRWNRALSLLQVGNFELGWREYEWRWQRKQTPARPFRQPRWDGSPQPCRTLLIYMEQGLGDILQFIRYAALARERVGRVVVECPYFVKPLLERCRGIDEVVGEESVAEAAERRGAGPGDPKSYPVPFDLQIPLMSLPGALGTTLATIPNKVPYLFVEESLVEKWGLWLRENVTSPVVTPRFAREEKVESRELSEKTHVPLQHATALEHRPNVTSPVVTPPTPPCQGGEKYTLPSHDSRSTPSSVRSTIHDPRSTTRAATRHPPLTIGIVWQGNPNHRLDRYRSIKLAEFEPLAKVPGVQLISLQKGPGAAQIEHVSKRFQVWKPSITEEMTAEALLDTAAFMKCLDLVISVDTGTAHLAGGLGVPVWVPISAIGEWRWLLEREDTPWYPTMRLFRQMKLGRWRSVFQRMAAEVKRLRRL
jgi:tetratricopeptide (TPR) repeat protein